VPADHRREAIERRPHGVMHPCGLFCWRRAAGCRPAFAEPSVFALRASPDKPAGKRDSFQGACAALGVEPARRAASRPARVLIPSQYEHKPAK